MILYFFIILVSIPTIDVAFYEADSDNSDCYDDYDNSNVTTTTQATTEAYTFSPTTALNSYWRCEDGFLMLNRTNGIWCVIAYQNGTYFNRNEAHEHCAQRYNGYLTGIASDAETTAISEYLLAVVGSGAVSFVGAQKYTMCRVVTNERFSTCSRTHSFFYYNATSQFLPVDDAVYGWADNYPQGSTTDTFASYTNYIYGAFSYTLGGVKDLTGTDKIGGALCGKPAVEVVF